MLNVTFSTEKQVKFASENLISSLRSNTSVKPSNKMFLLADVGQGREENEATGKFRLT